MKKVSDQTKINLINSFWNLYKNDDITKITVKKISDSAYYDRTTFYRYFNNIQDLLNDLEDEIIYKIKRNINNNNNKNSNILFHKFNNFNDKYGEYIIVFLKNNNLNFYSKFKKLIKNDVYSYFNINIGNADKEEFVFEFIFASLLNSYVYWYNHKNILSLEEFVKFANGLITNGVRTILDK